MKAYVVLALAAGLPLAAATYYVDSARGADVNSGNSPAAAWQTVARVNTARLRPGDRVLFKAGSVWRGQLVPSASGSPASPIVISRYGKGPRPRIDAAGQAEDAVRLYNIEGIELRDLEITNSGPAPAVRRGVHVYLDNFGTARHIVLAGLYIHDVNGSNQRKDNGGIVFRTSGDRTPTRFDGLLIERNIVWKVDHSGIAAQSSHWARTRWYPSLRVVIRDNLVDDIGGDGIVPWATDAAVVEHNIARNCNRRAATYNAGIWPWSTDNSVFQLNEACLTRTTMDGQGFDSDYNSRNTVFQYNLSHDNEGGFMLICTPGKRNAAENLGNTGTVVRYNISRNDRARIFHLSAAEQTTVHDNAIYVGPGLDVQMLVLTNWSGWARNAIFRNNSFFVDGIARYGHETARGKDGTYTIAPGWGPAEGIVFENNRYSGRHIGRPEEDAAAAAPPLKLDWDGPVFDPARPDNFDRFLDRHRRWMLRLFERQFGRPPQFARAAWEN
jgi:hypothetical protein